MFYILLTLDLTIFCCLSQLPRHCDTNHGTGITIYGQNIQRKNGEKEEKKFKIEIVEEVRTMPAIMEEKARVPKKPVLRKPYITPGFGPLALKYGSIVMGKSLKTGLVAYNEEKFQEFCDMVSDALQKKEKVTLVIKDWGKDDIPKEYMVVLPTNTPATNTPANYIRVNNNHK